MNEWIGCYCEDFRTSEDDDNDTFMIVAMPMVYDDGSDEDDVCDEMMMANMMELAVAIWGRSFDNRQTNH